MRWTSPTEAWKKTNHYARIQASTRFYKPALFDDTITITTTIAGKTGVKVTFKYEVFNQHNEKLTDGETVLVFADGKSKRPIKTPKFLKKIRYFQQIRMTCYQKLLTFNRKIQSLYRFYFPKKMKIWPFLLR